MQDFAKKKKKESHNREQNLLQIDEVGLVFLDKLVLKFNLNMERVIEMFNRDISKGKRQHIDEEIYVEFDFHELLNGWIGGFHNKCFSRCLFVLFFGRSTEKEDRRQDQDGKCEDEQPEKGKNS